MYGSGSSLLSFLSSVARQLPEIVVVVAGLVVVLGRKPGHPRASNLATLGLVVLLVTGLGAAAFWSLAPGIVEGPGALSALLAVASAGSSVLRACGLGLLVAAVVADRAGR